MPPAALRATCRLTARAELELERLSRIRLSLTGRGVDRLIKVARTLADLDDAEVIDADYVRDAARYRALDTLTSAHAVLPREVPCASLRAERLSKPALRS
jgi:magnesium chelatase family protein